MLSTLFRAAVLVTLVSAPALAQSQCYAENDGNTFGDGLSMGGPNELLAIRFVSPSNLSVTRIEVFTGEGTGTNTLSIWTHDGAMNHPATQISPAGSWSLINANSWQGADLGSAAALTNGTTYWVVWGCITQQQASVDVLMGSPGQPYAASFDGGVSWGGPFQSNDHHWKFRLFGNCGGGSPVTPFCFGDGTQATACPCANNGAAGHGCENSAGIGGAHLMSTGTTSPDTLVLMSMYEPSSVLSIVYQGDASVAGLAFGDGVSCLGGNQLKLYVEHAFGGMVTAPGTGAPSITQRSATLGDTIPSGATRFYQFVYRDKTPSFCPTGGTFNVTNGLTVVW